MGKHTEYATRALDRAVEEPIRKHRTIALSARDMETFVDALLNPGQPNERLRRYARLHEETVGDRWRQFPNTADTASWGEPRG